MKIGILGFGEIGQAIHKFYNKEDVYIKDIDRDELCDVIDILHVCIPQIPEFNQIVTDVMKKHNVGIGIIHSTVSLGTTETLFNSGLRIVHSPVRGMHPNLYIGIKRFRKYIGTDDYDLGKMAEAHFQRIGIQDTYVVIQSKNTEALKLWDTTIYGFNIVLEKEIFAYCEEHGLDFSVVYTDANKSYNKGYSELGHPEFCKYILKQVSGSCGGHCVIPNCHLLDSIISKFILERNEHYK